MQGGAKTGGPYAEFSALANARPASGDRPAGTLLPHLASPAAALRQVLAAHAVRDCAHIVEIGGAGLPITGFLTHRPQSVTVIDPKIPDVSGSELNGAPCRVRHVAAKLQQVDLTPPSDDVALILLGLSLKPFGRQAATPPALLALARAARMLVLDYALELPRALGQIGEIIGTRGEAAAIDLELRINDAALAAAGYDRRRFLVYERMQR